MQLQRQSNGQRITLDSTSVLGVGGEARVYAVQQDRTLVAKAYYRPTDAHVRKLAAMLANPPDDPMLAQGHISIAWPVDLLHTVGARQRFVGFLMARVRGMRSIIDFYNPKTRRHQCPLFHYEYLLHTARNLASAIRALHVRGYIIGDINESNILTTDTALVTLVDTDSFQVRDSHDSVVYRCPVGKPEFTAPELQGKMFAHINRAPEHDLFGLAVLIFQLLMEGTHPFSGIFTGQGDPPALEARISAGHFPYSTGRRVPYRPMPNAPPFEILHPTLQKLFLRCFEDGHNNPQARPDAATWQIALDQAEKALITCLNNDQHRYSNHLNSCPWCERAARLSGRDPFPSQQAVQRGHHQQPVVPIQTPLPAVKTQVRPTQPIPTPTPVPIPRRLFAPSRPHNGWAWTAMVSGLLALVPALHLWAGLAAAVCGVIGWGRAQTSAGHGRWMAGSALAVGGVMALSALVPIEAPPRSPPPIMLKSPPKTFTLGWATGRIDSVALSSDGKTIAGAAYDSRLSKSVIVLWDAKTGVLKRTLYPDHEGIIESVAFSLDSRMVVGGGSDTEEYSTPHREVSLWDVQTGKLLWEVIPPSISAVNIFAFSPDGEVIAVGGDRGDGKVRVLDLETGEINQTFDSDTGVASLTFSPDGNILASGHYSGAVHLWDAQAELIRTLKKPYAASLAFSPDGNTLAAAGHGGGAVYLWDVHTGDLKRILKTDDDTIRGHASSPPELLAFSPDSTILGHGAYGKYAYSMVPAEVLLWYVDTGKLQRVLNPQGGKVRLVAFSPGSKLVVVSDAEDLNETNMTVERWSVSTSSTRDMQAEELLQTKRIQDHIRTAMSHLDVGNYPGATDELEKATSIDPTNKEILRHLDRARRAWNAEAKLFPVPNR